MCKRRGFWLSATTALIATVCLIYRHSVLEHPDRLRGRALDSFRSGRWEIVEASLSKIERRGEARSEDRILRGRAARALGKIDEAISCWLKIVEGDPAHAEACRLIGEAEAARFRLRKAEAILKRAAELAPNRPEPHFHLAKLYAIEFRRKEFDDRMRQITACSHLKFLQITFWCQIDSSIWDPPRFFRAWTKALENDPGDRAVRLAYSEGLRRLDDRERALSILEPLGEADPDASALRARIALERGRLDLAEALLQSVPVGHFQGDMTRGRIARIRGRLEDAVRFFRNAYTADPEDRDAITELGLALGAAGKTAESRRLMALSYHCDQIMFMLKDMPIDQDPNSDFLERLGRLCEAAGRRDRALACYRLALDHNPLDRVLQEAIFRVTTAESIQIAK